MFVVVMNETIRSRVLGMSTWLRELRRDFHMYPELGLSEFRTSEKIRYYLEQMGIEMITYPNSTCTVGLIRGAYPGKTVAIRADMDALPIQEINDVPYKSKNEGIMHACGHDAHMTILLGAALYFSEIQNRLKGNVKLLFQPAEETVGGALDMVKAGCMKNPDVDYVIGLHVMPEYPVGAVEIKYGTLNAASDVIDITVRGKKAHGAYPENGVDAIVISAQIISALQTVTSRGVSPLDSAVFTVGVINGGTAANIIADKVEMKAILRTVDEKTREKAKKMITGIVKGISESMGGSADIVITKGYDALVNDVETMDVVAQAARELLGVGQPVFKEKTSLGVEDFSFFANVCKGAFYHLGCGNPEKSITSPIHTDTFDIDEDCLPIGVMMHVETTLKLLNSD